MNNQYMSAGEAAVLNNLMPGNQNLGAGSKLRNALLNSVPVKTKWFVDGTNGGDDKDGLSWDTAFATIQKAIDSASAFDTIIVIPKTVSAGATDPGNYAENLIIPVTKQGLLLIGYGTGRTQGGLPQIKKGSGTSALLTVRAPGCLIANLGFNGSGSTGGGILLDDDAVTKSAWGTTISGCHFKNCVGPDADDATEGGAIQWATTAEGAAWQVLIKGNMFYKNVGDIVSFATAGLQPQDIVIEDNIFSGPAADVDCNIYMKGAGTTGVNGLYIQRNIFPALPAIGANVARFMDLTGCIGILADNFFGDTTTATGYGAAKTKAKIPVTMFMVNNYNESGLITREN